jgi:broad specificity phosphatase PhoE
MTTLIFIRHGETEWNRSGRWQGHADVPLSDEGREQAQRLAARLKREGPTFDGLYASDLGRALETAQIVAQELGLEVHPLVELREIHVGAWSGLTSDEIRTRFPEEWEQAERGRDFRRGGHGESLADFRARIVHAVERLVETHPDQRLLVATHGGAVRAVLYYISELTDHGEVTRIENTSLTEVVFEDGAPRVVRANDIAHLEPTTTSGMPASA